MTDHELSQHPLRLIGTVYRSFARLVDGELRELGFAMGQLPVLIALKKNRALPQAELARIARVEQSSMAQLLNRMERDDLIKRVADADDRRSRLISLTDTAARRMPKGRAVMENTSRLALAGFSQKELAQLQALLLRINANLDAVANEDEI